MSSFVGLVKLVPAIVLIYCGKFTSVFYILFLSHYVLNLWLTINLVILVQEARIISIWFAQKLNMAEIHFHLRDPYFIITCHLPPDNYGAVLFSNVPVPLIDFEIVISCSLLLLYYMYLFFCVAFFSVVYLFVVIYVFVFLCCLIWCCIFVCCFVVLPL